MESYQETNSRAASQLTGLCLKKARRLRYWCLRTRGRKEPLDVHYQGDAIDTIVREKLLAPEPFMYGRLGRSEIRATLLALDIATPENRLKKALAFLRSDIGPFWWDRGIIRRAHINAGLFPPTPEIIYRYAQRMLEDVRDIDLLGTMHPEDRRLLHLFAEAPRLPLGYMFPFHRKNPWTSALTGKTVLVIYPFAETIEKQYAKREFLFKNPEMLPAFTLKTLKTVQSVGGTSVDFPDWFAALETMCEQIKSIEFDVALIGAGAYGLPLAAFVKRLGKKALHLGGETQMVFGIRGKRWDDDPTCQSLFNEHWTYPSPADIIPNANAVEDGCYW